MTEKFEFSEPQIRLELCGREYFVVAGEKTAEICNDVLIEAKMRLKRLKRGECDEQLSEAGICSFFMQSIERLIGLGEVDKIFGSRCRDVSAMAELLCYIASKIKAAYSEQTVRKG